MGAKFRQIHQMSIFPILFAEWVLFFLGDRQRPCDKPRAFPVKVTPHAASLVQHSDESNPP